MAKGQGAGLIWTSVIFAFLWIISMVLAIVFYTQIEAAKFNEKQAVGDLTKYISKEERGQQMVVEMKSAGTGTVFTHLLTEINQLKQLVIGSSTAALPAIKKEMQALDLEEGQPLIRELRRMRAEIQSASELEKELDNKYKAAAARAQASETAKNQSETNFSRSVSQLQSKLTAQQNNFKLYQRKVDQQRNTLDSQLKRSRKKADLKQSQQTSRITQLETETKSVKDQLKKVQLENPRTGLAKVDTTRIADGHIADLLLEQNLVYLDLGRVDRLITGITFEVYDRNTGVVPNAQGFYRGKATVEVINVFENSSVARIVRFDKGREIFEGDLIANLIYDPKITFKFYVYGDYDLDHIGKTQVSDRRRVENMVIQWGGQLIRPTAEKNRGLTYDVDFLVLGEMPKMPKNLADDEVNPQVIEVYAKKRKKYVQYQNLVGHAIKLSVPILNQNRFLTMVGYYKR